ncbi:MAG: hypothetical protein A3D67_00660 [Candidatus Lloydbacteria bacterium RIFCSPHIGHO2_02_FULL_51_22]|uniref:Uncharacterized protein n=3 Tax=Candidatus Lloydiibacteriota TaxID=1817910 RepID=A0A1G2DFQ5_9BACT|nr:MAG: hypothetical protein A3D67_00660 [Candidatus Lloydbacteria bacterium RIFCSPHIGHO2_02_FULL_51_22]OGZ15877.1 MAG: hypothetical protein A3J08_04515 [Candidatus Lloydbacteria bacterium RIFCSPLOWO2_02_FULL_51_11]OGZ16241.1 MAG: hypothetical protein A3G11_00070 [Candidatus Lloydbacteria bacterium RIFCSPLOWO2_12_FULL_51_9]
MLPTLPAGRQGKTCPDFVSAKRSNKIKDFDEIGKIVSGAAHFDFAQHKPPPFRIFAGLRLAEVASTTQAGGFLAARGGEMSSDYFKNGAYY